MTDDRRVLPDGVHVYRSKWDRPGIGFYSGSNVADEGPDPIPGVVERDFVRRVHEMTVMSERVRQHIREATERRRALNDRLRALLKRLDP